MPGRSCFKFSVLLVLNTHALVGTVPSTTFVLYCLADCGLWLFLQYYSHSRRNWLYRTPLYNFVLWAVALFYKYQYCTNCTELCKLHLYTLSLLVGWVLWNLAQFYSSHELLVMSNYDTTNYYYLMFYNILFGAWSNDKSWTNSTAIDSDGTSNYS